MARLSAIMSHTETEMGWDQVSPQYAVPWPLHLVVTPTALEKYNLIFCFLLLVRRTQAALHQLWAEAMFKRSVSRRQGDKTRDELDTVAQTRQHMTFLVDNLQYFFMADMLNNQVSAIKNKLANSTVLRMAGISKTSF